MMVLPIDTSLSRHLDPEQYRMTIGEHLDELRKRLILGLAGFVVALLACLFYGSSLVTAFCQPLIDALIANRINPQLVVNEVSEGFMVLIRISVITASAIASPWIVTQLWLFVAAGLYAEERKYVTRFLPLSVGLLCIGMVFAYWLVLPWTLGFFVEFNSDFASRFNLRAAPAIMDQAAGAEALPLNIPMLGSDPAALRDGDLWFDTGRGLLKFVQDGQIRVISFNSSNLLAQEYKLAGYIDWVVMMLLTFGICFQLPLIVLALERTGIVDIDSLRRGRKGVYFAIVMASAIISPGDTTTVTVALMIPLFGLYELGILLASLRQRRAVR